MYEYVLWLVVAAYALHILEEYTFDWTKWAKESLKLPVNLTTFYMTNATAMIIFIAFAVIGWRLPEVTLAAPALIFINSVFFHILPTIVLRRFSPGVITSLFLYIPLAYFAYYGAYLDGVLTPSVFILSGIIGALLMAYPVVLLKTKQKLD